MDLRDVGFDAGDWIDFAQGRVQWLAYVRVVISDGSNRHFLVC